MGHRGYVTLISNSINLYAQKQQMTSDNLDVSPSDLWAATHAVEAATLSAVTIETKQWTEECAAQCAEPVKLTAA